jgi:hypothetical protein
MSHYLDMILPFDPEVKISEDDVNKLAGELSIDLEDFAQKLLIRWPKGKADVFAAANFVEWQIPEPRPNQDAPDGGDGSLIEGCIVQFYYFPLEVIAEFALWYRTYIPLEHPLFLMNESGRGLELLETTTSKDILGAYGWKVPDRD